MCLKTRRDLLRAVATRYPGASDKEKVIILNEFVKSTEYHRKYAIRLINQAVCMPVWPSSKPRLPRLRRRKYGPDVEQPLMSLWRFSGCLCPKRLMPFLPVLVDALERFDELRLSASIKQKLLQMSVSTAERIVGSLRRSEERGISTTKAGTLLRHQIPIRTYEDWNDVRPGFFEIDLVAHCGNSAAGEFVHTLTMTDIATGWSETYALSNRSKITVTQAIDVIRKRIPFPLLGIDTDNGAEFMNHHLKHYCDDSKITFTRCRPYKKNDQCHVEQKNGALVRPLVGYSRYEGVEATKHLNELYAVHRLCVNFFEPSMKLLEKTRTGARVKKTYDAAKTPWQRLECAQHLEPQKQQLIQLWFLKLNPASLRRKLRDLELKLRIYAVNNPPPGNQTATPDNGGSDGK